MKTSHARTRCTLPAALALSLALSLPMAAAYSATPALGDPTRPSDPQAFFGGGSDTVQEGGLRLTSIVIGPGRRTATINGTTVGEGDRVSGARVEAIRHGEVVLRGNRGPFTLSLVPDPKTSTRIQP